MKIRVAALAVSSLALVGIAGSASAAFTATFTADNHYAIYQEIGGVISLVGGNELGAGGAPGTYNWSMPETHSISSAASTVYIAAWSDDQVAQGVLGEIDLGGGNWLRSGDPRWEYYCSNINLNDGSPWPAASEVSDFVAAATTGNLWQTPDAGLNNVSSTSPWNKIDGISDEARWMWGNPDQSANAFTGGSNHEEYQLFRISIPSQGSSALASIAGLLAVRRRRN